MTTLVDSHSPGPAPDPMRTPSGPIRYVAIRANLLPDELIRARRANRVKTRSLVTMGVVVLLVVGWYVLSLWATSGVKSDLTTAQLKTTQLRAEQHKYQPLVEAKAQSSAIDDALSKLMAGDVNWQQMLTTVRQSAPKGVTVSSVSGTVTAGAATASGSAAGGAGFDVLNTTGKQVIGSLTIGGTAPNKSAVAGYVNSLGTVTGLTAPFPASVATANGNVSFSVNVIVTTDALGGRFTDPAPTGGK